MRTHLLRTFYPPTDLEFDTGRASNDDRFAAHDSKIAQTPNSEPAAQRENSNPLLDEYELGGYAGI